MFEIFVRSVLVTITITTLGVEGTNMKIENPYLIQQRNSQRAVYTTSWAIEIVRGGKKMANAIADQYGFNNLGNIDGLNNVYHFELRGLEKLRARTDSPYTSKSKKLLSEPCIGFAEQQVIRPRIAKSYTVPTDPLFQSQWNLLNSGQYGNAYKENDLKVERAWLQGLSGCNITVVVVDDGLEFTHRDLWDNYVPQVSYDFVENDTDPSSNSPWHGTSCGGIIGSAKDNQMCGVGIAYNSNLGGVAVLGSNSDINEGRSLTIENNIVDIYSNSWGPFDSGDVVEGPGPVTKLALQNGVQEGRDGKGSIFVWANGNGGVSDDCAADGYAASIYTISVGAIGVDGTPSPFDEQCSAKLVVTYVTNLDRESEVSTTALNGECTTSFGGTSAATPMAAGIIALVLEANTNLTWRDVQYLIVYTANPLLTDATMYTINGAGLLVSHQFGFGVMDAEALVTRARHWINVLPQIEEHLPSNISGKSTFTAPFVTNINYSGSIRYLEHAVVQMSVEVVDHSNSKRGDIKIELISPSGTLSKLLSHRSNDHRSGGYFEWPFMSVMFWGENPTGEWNLTVYSLSGFTKIDISNIEFHFFGVSTVPEAVANIPDVCHSNCVRGCAKEGSDYCDECINLRNAYTLECIDVCPPGYSERNGYCFNSTLPAEECNSPLKLKEEGSCVDSGFNGCCTDDNCEVVVQTSPFTCFCDALCHIYGDCCDDIFLIGCHQKNTTEVNAVLPYIELWVTDGVETLTVPARDDGISPPVSVQFPFGFQLQSTVFVGTNGYFTFEEFTGYTPFPFDARRNESLVAPFFTDIDISNGIGQINYEIHTESTSKHLLSKIDSIINEYLQTNFSGKWMIVAEWDGVPQYGGDPNITNTFQGVLTTDFVRSFAVFIYYCGDLGFSNRATIGFVTEDGLFANHESTHRGIPKAIGCLNMPCSPWMNVVYEVAISENECELDNGGCEHICSDTFYSFECSCRDGYSLNADGFTCRDINECSGSTNECMHICVNTIGSYTCECRKDYVLDSNGKSCSISCGGTFTETNGTFHTPDWPMSYPALDFHCEWMIDIESLTNTALEITFHDQYGIRGRDPCPTDYVQVLDGIEKNSTSLGKYCFLDAPDPIITSSQTATVIFQASTNPHSSNRVGVYISYSAILIVNECETDNGGCADVCLDTAASYICSCNEGYTLDSDNRGCIDVDECSTSEHDCEDICENTDGSYTCSCGEGYELDANGRFCSLSCGGRLTEANGAFHTPDWPLSYPALDFCCEWVIDIENLTNSVIEITFHEEYGIHGREPCPTDYVQVFDGTDQDSASLGKYCFLNTPAPIITSSPRATVIFQASTNPHMSSRVGVSITYTSILTVNECEIKNGGCEHKCMDTYLSYQCSCDNGYTLDTDSRGCIDVDECSTSEHDCEDICENTDGSYTCSCGEGYELDANGRSCSISCGGRLTEANGTFHTPDWPLSYPALDFRCEWVIDIENLTNSVIEITFHEEYGIHGREPCPTDYVQVFDGTDQDSASLGKYCFLDTPAPIITSSPRATVIFQASTNPHTSSRVGVSVSYTSILTVNECEIKNGGCEHKCMDTSLSYQCSCDNGYTLDTDSRGCIDVDECSTSEHDCEDICENTDGSYTCSCGEGYELDANGRSCSISCGGRLTEANGTFHTPDWPLSYPALDFRCEWVIDIENQTNSVIEITFHEEYGIHGREPCPTDYVQVFDGTDQDSASLGKYCFLNTPAPIITSSPRATVIFQASTNPHTSSRVGVSVSYTSILTVNECETDNGGCEHNCIDTFSSYQCSCDDGYALDEDSRGCIDVDECSAGEHDCEHICNNTNGSYTCSCRQGYTLDGNGRSCSISCGERLTEANGSFHTPDWPLRYPSLNFQCVWVIDLENLNDTVIEISFDEKYGIHGRDPCPTDYVQILDGVEQDSTSLGKYCSTRAPEPIITSSNRATVIFQASTDHHLSSRVGALVSYAIRPIVDDCEVGNGGCAQICVDTLHSYTCSCNDGYRINQDGHNCNDIDECSTTEHGCEQICVNNDGSYTCECRDGFSLETNGKTCSISCGGNFSNTSGSFQTPEWPHTYPQEDFICEWTLDMQGQGSIRFVVDSSAYGINGRPPCPEDHIEFFDGVETDSRSLGRYCKLNVPEPITVSSGVARVVFEGRRNFNRPSSRKGVRVTYEIPPQ